LSRPVHLFSLCASTSINVFSEESRIDDHSADRPEDGIA
jgi:hypothetical protein